MTTYLLRVGYVTFKEEVLNSYYLDIIERLATSYGGKQKQLKSNAFTIPCSVDCQDTSCTDTINCGIVEYNFKSEADITPDNLMKCHGALAMLDPVCAVKTVNPNDPTDEFFWNRFDEDDDKLLDKEQVLN